MESIRLKRENINLEKKNKELLAQISELSTKIIHCLNKF